MGYRPREQRPRVYLHPKYGRYEDEKQYDSYNYRYDQSQSYGRRRRDDNDYYDTNYNDSYIETRKRIMTIDKVITITVHVVVNMVTIKADQLIEK